MTRNKKGQETMKATITRVANGYTAEMEGRIYVGASPNDIMRLLMQRGGDELYAALADCEGGTCEVEVTLRKN